MKQLKKTTELALWEGRGLQLASPKAWSPTLTSHFISSLLSSVKYMVAQMEELFNAVVPFLKSIAQTTTHVVNQPNFANGSQQVQTPLAPTQELLAEVPTL